jgi:hypothetical protein
MKGELNGIQGTQVVIVSYQSGFNEFIGKHLP